MRFEAGFSPGSRLSVICASVHLTTTGKLSVGVFVVALAVYVLTLAPGLMWGGGDFAKFQTQLYTGEIEGGIFGHPLWVIAALPFLWLPLRDVAYRANLASAVFASAALVVVFNAAALLA